MFSISTYKRPAVIFEKVINDFQTPRTMHQLYNICKDKNGTLLKPENDLSCAL